MYPLSEEGSRTNFKDVAVLHHLEDPEVDWSIIFIWVFRKWDVGAWTRSSWLRIGTCGGQL
jgi:hypothetical protein